MKYIYIYLCCFLAFNACALNKKNSNNTTATINISEQQLQKFYLTQNFEILKRVERAEVFAVKDHHILGTENEYYKKNILIARLDKIETKKLQQLLLNTNNYDFSNIQSNNYNPQLFIILYDNKNESVSVLYEPETKLFSTISLNGQNLCKINKKIQHFLKQYIL